MGHVRIKSGHACSFPLSNRFSLQAGVHGDELAGDTNALCRDVQGEVRPQLALPHPSGLLWGHSGELTNCIISAFLLTMISKRK